MFRRHSILAAAVVAAAACDAPQSTAPRGPGAPAATKQGTTSSQILLSITFDDGNDGLNWEIFRMNDDGTNIVRLTYEPATSENEGSWAPDGKRILFKRAYADRSEIFVMNADGTGVTQLTSTPAYWYDTSPIAFGKQVAFTRSTSDISSIYVMNADGTGMTQLPQTIGGSHPAPSPKDGRIAFHLDGDIYLLDVTTGGLTNLTNSAEFETDPAYSPSGKQIAFMRFGAGGGIFVMNDDGTQVTRLTTSPESGPDQRPHWSPDGKRIAFTGLRDGSYGIYVMSADGTSLTDLSRTPLTPEYLSAWAQQ